MQKLTEAQKREVDHLVEIWISGLQSISNDAGWQGTSLAARLIEYMGQIPVGTGNDQSNLTMINAIALLRNQHARFPDIACAMRMLISDKATRDSAYAIAAKHFYRSTAICEWTRKPYTNEDRAAELDMSLNDYNYALRTAYPLVHGELERVNIYRQFLAA